MSDSPRFKRMAAEGLVIVASILLAFTVDAWWGRQSDRDDQVEVLRAVEQEFHAYQVVLDQASELLQELTIASEVLIDSLMSVPEGEFVVVPESTLRAALEWPTLRIPLATVEPAGVVDPELGSLIRQWQAEVRTTVSRYDSARDLVFSQIRPLLGEEIDLVRLDRQAADFHLRGIEPVEGTVRVRRTTALVNALSGRESLMYGASLGITRLNGWGAEVSARLASVE